MKSESLRQHAKIVLLEDINKNYLDKRKPISKITISRFNYTYVQNKFSK